MITEDKIGSLLTDVDRRADRPPVLNAESVIASVLCAQSRKQRKTMVLTGCSSIAAVILVIGLVWIQHDRSKRVEIVQLQNKVELLNQRLDSAMAMVQKTLDIQRQQEKQAQLERKLAEYGNFKRQLETQEENAALTILIEADRLRNASLHKDAEAFYMRVVDLYPNTCWAQVAGQKLESARQEDENKTKGNTL